MAITQDDIAKITGKAERDMIQHLDGLFNEARKSRLPYEHQWYLNMAFYFGRQYVQWQGSTAVGPQSNIPFTRLWEPPAPHWRVRLVANRIRPMIRTELAKLTKEKPTGYVIPSTADDDDLAAARAAENIWDHLWREKKMQKVIRRAVFWALLCGNGFIKDWWDANAPSSDGKRGDIMAEPVSPFHLVVPDIQQEELDDQPYIIHTSAKPPEWIEKVYGKSVAPDANSAGAVLEQKFLSALGIKTSNKSLVTVKEAWIKSSKKFPNGAFTVWAGDTLLVEPREEWPYEHKQYPFTKFDHVPTGRFYSDSTIVDAIPLQKEYNRTRSQIIEAKNRMAKPQLAAARGSIDASKITSEPGLIVFYTPGFQPPQPIPLTPLPNYVIEELDRNIRDLDDISGQHEVTKGRTPPGVTAATAISYLQEEDDSKLSHSVTSVEEGVERLGRHFLSHVKQYWAAQRIIKVLGDNNQYESFLFGKADIRGNTDFRVEAGSATPRSKAAKQAFIIELGKLGWVPGDRALKYLDMAETGRMYEEMMLDARQAQRENLRMSLGEGLPDPNAIPIPGQEAAQPEVGFPVEWWHEHAVHMVEHNNFRKKQQFEDMPDEIKQVFEMHMQMHWQFLQLQAVGQLPPTSQIPEEIKQTVNINAMSMLSGGGGEQVGPAAGTQ